MNFGRLEMVRGLLGLSAMKILFWILVGLTGACFSAVSANAVILKSEQPMTRDRLLEVFSAHPGITELDQVPALLPKPFLSNFVLKHGYKRNGERGHLVETKVSQSSDPQLPRAVLFDERTGFSVSYNGGGPNQTAGHRLDILSFSDLDSTFHLEQIDFPIQPGRPLVTTSDCASCHGPHHRPIFSMYPDWPSFYGSDNDELNGTSPVQKKELADYLQFRNGNGTTHPRYAPLFDSSVISAHFGVSVYPTFPYRQDVSAVATEVSRAFTFRPGLRMGVVYNRLNTKAVFQRIKSHANYAEFAPFFLFNTLQCTWPQESKVAHAKIHARVATVLQQTPQFVSKASRRLNYAQNLALFDLTLPDVDIRYSYSHPGNQNTDASKKIMEVGYIGDYFNSYFDGTATADELLAASLYNDLTAKISKLQGVAQAHGLTEKYRHLKARFQFDQNFFEQVDSQGMWIPIPYPKEVFLAHHRETYKPQFKIQHTTLCKALLTEF